MASTASRRELYPARDVFQAGHACRVIVLARRLLVLPVGQAVGQGLHLRLEVLLAVHERLQMGHTEGVIDVGRLVGVEHGLVPVEGFGVACTRRRIEELNTAQEFLGLLQGCEAGRRRRG